MARALTLLLATAVLVAEDDGSSVKAHIDALRAGGGRFVHNTLPSPKRRKELFPDSEVRGGLRQRLRKNEHGRAILESGEAGVTELIGLLKVSEEDRYGTEPGLLEV